MKQARAAASVYSQRAKLGVIVPPTNTVNEAEWHRLVPDGVTFHVTRMALHTDTESEAGRAALYADVRHAAGDLAQAGVDVIAYACTAGSMMRPVTALGDFMADKTGIPSVTTAEALIEALGALGTRRLSLATPYHQALTDHEVGFLAAHGVETLAAAGLGYGANGPEEYRLIAPTPPDVAYALAKEVDRHEAEAILISCTDFATLEIIEPLEDELDKPVLTSNTATLWAALRRAGIEDALPGGGRLLREH